MLFNNRSHLLCFFFFSSRRRHTRWNCDWSSDVCSSDLSRSTRPSFFERREFREFSMRLALIPVRYGRDVIGERLIGPVGPPAQSLDSGAQFPMEADWVHDMPAIQAPFGRTARPRVL